MGNKKNWSVFTQNILRVGDDCLSMLCNCVLFFFSYYYFVIANLANISNNQELHRFSIIFVKLFFELFESNNNNHLYNVHILPF